MSENIKPPSGYEEGASEPDESPIDDLHPLEQERNKSTQPPAKPEEKTPEVKEGPKRYIVQSYAELMIRGAEHGRGRVRVWDMGVREGINESVNKKYQEAVPEKGSYIDGVLFRVLMPYAFEFDAYGPDLNNPEGRRIRFWGGRIIRDEYEKWAGRIDLGFDDSGRSQEEYQRLFRIEQEEDRKRQARRNRRRY